MKNKNKLITFLIVGLMGMAPNVQAVSYKIINNTDQKFGRHLIPQTISGSWYEIGAGGKSGSFKVEPGKEITIDSTALNMVRVTIKGRDTAQGKEADREYSNTLSAGTQGCICINVDPFKDVYTTVIDTAWQGSPCCK